MSFVDMIASAMRSQAQEMFKPDFSKCQYVTPCCSNVFNEHGTSVGYYVDQFGRKWHQDGSGMVSEERTVPYVHIPTPEFVAERMMRECGDPIDVTFEEVK